MISCLKWLAAILLALLAGATSCFGQSDAALADPTRPPIVAPEPPPAASPEGAPPPSGLQVIIIGKGRKPMAVINGTTVEVGDKVGEATLVKLSETQAVLKGPEGMQVFDLTPVANKTDNTQPKPGAEQKSATKRPKRQTTP